MRLLATAFKTDDAGNLTTTGKGLAQTTLDGFVVRYRDDVKVAQVRAVHRDVAVLFPHARVLSVCMQTGEQFAPVEGHQRPAAQQVRRPAGR